MPTDTRLPNNGVAITQRDHSEDSFRTYEIYQRERPGESTEKIGPGQLTAPAQLVNPFPVLEVLRENYPCYRDWSGNAYWLTRYDDVTSVFADRFNFNVQTRAEACGFRQAQDLSAAIPAHRVWAELIDNQLPGVCQQILDELAQHESADLSIDYALRLCVELQRMALGLSAEHSSTLARLLWHIQRGDSWAPEVVLRAQQAARELHQLLGSAPIDHAQPGLREAMPELSADDLLATVLGFEARTLHGWIANLCQAWLTDPEVETSIRKGHAQVKIATLEAMRHAPPVAYAHCRALHEVERFGRLLPEGALVRLSAEAANRDPRVFTRPDEFIPDRRDICHREARGQYRADGLATGIAFGLGLPSRYPAVPEDRPRSLYALTRDATVVATEVLLARFPSIRAAAPLEPPHALAMFEAMIAWSLPVTLDA